MLRGLPSVVLFVAAAALVATSLLFSLPTASTGPPPAQVLERQGLTLVHLSAQRKHFVWTGAKAEAWCLLIHADASLYHFVGVCL